MSRAPLNEARLRFIDCRWCVHAPRGRGAELRERLAALGIVAADVPLHGASYDRLALDRDVDTRQVQNCLDGWNRDQSPPPRAQ